MAQSLYRQASLVMNPYGAKDTLLPSIKPTDGSGDFTFSRDGAGGDLAATRVNASGLIEKGRENVLLQSNQFDTTWVNTDTTETGGQAGYDGTNDAWLLTKTGADGFVRQFVSASGVYTFSIYAKAGTLNFCRVYMASSVTSVAAYVDLTDGSVGTLLNSPIDVVTQSVGGGWYRISITHNDSGMNNFRIYPAQADNDTSGTSGNIYIQDAQLEQGLVATDYIETTTAAVSAGLLGDMPRLDYSGGATCPSLLLEPSRTNAVTQSEYFDGGSLTNTTISAEYNTADTLSPEGVYNAAKLTATGSFPRYYDYPSTSDNTDIVISSFAKAGDASVYSLFASDKNLDAAQVYFDLSAGTATLAGTSVLTPVGYDIEPMGNGWYRCWLSINTGTGASSVQIRPIAHAQGQSGGWSGSNYIYAYGAQYETGSYPTSYIPTYGSASTRGADDMDTTFSTPFSTDGSATFFIELKGAPISAENSNTRNFSLDFASGDYITYNHGSTSAHRLKVEASGTAYYSTSGISDVLQDDDVKMAAAVTSTSVVMYVNGQEAVNTSLVGDWDSATLLRTAIQDLIGIVPVKQFIFFPTSLTNAELAALTTL